MSNIRWSEQQKEIFEWFKSGKGSLVVQARAGAAKTTTIIEGINHAPESHILMCAFNKSIANELQERVDNKNAEVKTLHSLGYRHLPGTKLSNYRVKDMLRQATDRADVIDAVAKLVSMAKNVQPYATEAEDVIDLIDEYEILVPEKCDQMYMSELAIKVMTKCASMEDKQCDFDDMLFVPVRNNLLRPTYDLVVVDECQDLNTTQMEMIAKISKPGARVVMVGDRFQALYAWRGASKNAMELMQKKFKASELKLTTTYRCPSLVVDLAKTLVPDIEAAPNAKDGTVKEVPSERMFLDADRGDFILSRFNAPLARVCLRLLREGKPARIAGADIGKSLVALVNKLGRLSGAKGGGYKPIAQFFDHLNIWEKDQVDRLNRENKPSLASGVRDRAETIRVLADGLKTTKELVTKLEEIFVDPSSKNVILCSSVHKSKGLEATRVWVLKETLNKLKGSEENNIAYVAYTRSKDSLFLVKGFGNGKE